MAWKWQEPGHQQPSHWPNLYEIQWNLYKETIELCGLSRQVVILVSSIGDIPAGDDGSRWSKGTSHDPRGGHGDSVFLKHTRYYVNSLDLGRCYNDFKCLIFKNLLVNDIISVCSPCCCQDLTDENSALVQVMAWCHQATSHYLTHCCSRPMTAYGVSRPPWVNPFSNELSDNIPWYSNAECCWDSCSKKITKCGYYIANITASDGLNSQYHGYWWPGDAEASTAVVLTKFSWNRWATVQEGFFFYQCQCASNYWASKCHIITNSPQFAAHLIRCKRIPYEHLAILEVHKKDCHWNVLRKKLIHVSYGVSLYEWVCLTKMFQSTLLWQLQTLVNPSWIRAAVVCINTESIGMILIWILILILMLSLRPWYWATVRQQYHSCTGTWHWVSFNAKKFQPRCTLSIINSSRPGKCGNNFKSVIFQHKLQIKFTSTFETALRWMLQNTFDDNQHWFM